MLSCICSPKHGLCSGGKSPFSHHTVCQNIAVVTSPDRVLAHNFILRVRGGILRNLKAVFRELVTVEQFYHQENSYYATFARRAASDGDKDYNNSDPKRKRQRTQNGEDSASPPLSWPS